MSGLAASTLLTEVGCLTQTLSRILPALPGSLSWGSPPLPQGCWDRQPLCLSGICMGSEESELQFSCLHGKYFIPQVIP